MKNGSNVSTHILPTSATMVGVCMTVISIVKISNFGPVGTMIDKLLGADTLLFLLSAFFSYFSLRLPASTDRLEFWADNAFVFGLMIMGVGAFLFAFEVL
jgi:hypothetical protein